MNHPYESAVIKTSPVAGVTLVEGLSFRRSTMLCDAATFRVQASVPRMSRMSADRVIKDHVFSIGTPQRDAASEAALMLGVRRACFVDAVAKREDDTPTLIRMHLLSSYSSLRDDSFTPQQWVRLVRAIFGNELPQNLIMLDHRTRDGKLDPAQIENTGRNLELVERDCRRRYEALDALIAEYDMNVLNLPAGASFRSESSSALSFISPVSVTQ